MHAVPRPHRVATSKPIAVEALHTARTSNHLLGERHVSACAAGIQKPPVSSKKNSPRQTRTAAASPPACSSSASPKASATSRTQVPRPGSTSWSACARCLCWRSLLAVLLDPVSFDGCNDQRDRFHRFQSPPETMRQTCSKGMIAEGSPPARRAGAPHDFFNVFIARSGWEIVVCRWHCALTAAMITICGIRLNESWMSLCS